MHGYVAGSIFLLHIMDEHHLLLSLEQRLLDLGDFWIMSKNVPCYVLESFSINISKIELNNFL